MLLKALKVTRLFVLAASGSWSLAAQTYSVDAEQHAPVGQTYRFSASGSSRQIFSSGDRTLQATEFGVVFEGQAQVLAVDKAAQPYKLAFTVQKFTRTQNGTKSEVLPSGSVLLADGSRKEHYALSDGTLDKEAQQAFSVVYSTHDPDSDISNDIFGTKQARAVGQSWPIDGELALKSLQKSVQEAGISLTAEQVSGTVRFAAVDKIADSECARLDAQITVGNFTLKNLPPGVLANRGTFKGQLSGCFSVSRSTQSFREGENLNARVSATGPNEQQVELSVEQKVERTWLASRKKP